jgi:type VI secretion system protein ImpF
MKARATIIDRLVDYNPKSGIESVPLRTLSPKALQESIRRDLTWLFNTRTPVTPERFDEKVLTVIDFGIPDFGACCTSNKDHHRLLAERLNRAIAAYEPRLKNISVTIKPEMVSEIALTALIDATVVTEEVRMPVSFVTIFEKNTVDVSIQDAHDGQ